MISTGTPHLVPDVTATFDRTLVNTAGDSVRHLVVTVRAPEPVAADATQRPPLNIGLVVDASGSMSGGRLDAAKLAMLDVIAALDDTDHLSLVSFADAAETHAAAVMLGGSGRGTLSRAVQSIASAGSTNLAAGWLAGCEAVAGRQATCDVLERNHVVLLSDGHANQGETAPVTLARHATELRRRGILTSTVGVGSNYSPTQLQSIAEAGGGRMHDAERPDEIARIVMAELTDTLATTVENLEVRLTFPAGVEAELYGTAPCSVRRDGCDVFLGSMIGGTVRRIVIKLRLPAGDAGSTLQVRVTGRWQAPGEAETHDADVEAAPLVFDTATACQNQRRDDAIARIVADQWQAHVYNRAMTLNQDGQEEAACEFVRRELPHLIRYCEGLPDKQDAVRALGRFGESVRQRYSAWSSKELLLHAYKTSRNEADHRPRSGVDFEALVAHEESERAKSRRRRN